MKIRMHGAGNEVGRSCIEITSKNNRRFLFDAGLKITPDLPEFPTTIKNIENIQAVFISHIHLDHTGALPLLHSQGLKCKIFASRITKALLPILLKDSWKIAKIENQNVAYNKTDIDEIIKNVELYNEDYDVKANSLEDEEIGFYDSETTVLSNAPKEIQGGSVKVFDAGHIPGAKSVLLNIDGESVIYSGDINPTETIITRSMDYKLFPKDLDVLIIESTYGDRDHANRITEENELFEKIRETLNQGGYALVPTFSIGRAQELIMLFTEQFPDVTIYLDGMAKTITETYLNVGNIKNTKLLRKAFDNVKRVKSQKERENVLNKQCIIVTTSGMLDGGPVLYYLPKIAKDSKSSILLTGYQAEETNGRRLLKEGHVIMDEQKIDVNCFFKNYDLSGHAGSSELFEVVKNTMPKHLVINHGDIRQMTAFKEKIKQELGIICHTPKNDSEVEINL